MLGLLSPDGKFFECKYGKHTETADKILKEYYNETSYLPVESLCKKGWMSIQRNFCGFVLDKMYHLPAMTYEQKVWLSSHIQDMNIEQYNTYQLLNFR